MSKTVEERYHVTNLYDVDYLLDENHVVVLQGNRPPTVADMEGIARRYNFYDALRAAAEAALEAQVQLNGHCDHEPRYAEDCLQCQLRAALSPKEQTQ